MKPSVRRTLSRRRFVGAVGAFVAAAAVARGGAWEAALAPSASLDDAGRPWFRSTRRWVQTNLNEQDLATYDPAVWADYWQRVRA